MPPVEPTFEEGKRMILYHGCGTWRRLRLLRVLILCTTAIAPTKTDCFQCRKCVAVANGRPTLHGTHPTVVFVAPHPYPRRQPVSPFWGQRRAAVRNKRCLFVACWSSTNGAANNNTPRRKRTDVTAEEAAETVVGPTNHDDSTIAHHSQPYTLEYSPNFHRHIVRDWNGCVVQSYLWLDDAVTAYPSAVRLPVPSYQQYCYHQCLYSSSSCSSANNNSSTGANNCYLPNDDVAAFVAGGGLEEATAYPVTHLVDGDDEVTKNTDRIYIKFQSLLMWYPAQVDKLMERWPPLRFYPAALLQERLMFLLAPLPDDDFILQQANVTDDVDWPRIFYGTRRGAGMSVAQVSHALQVLPEPFLLRLNYNAYYCVLQSDPLAAATVNSLETSYASNNNECSTTTATQVAVLYDQTPPLVVQMTHKVLNLWVTGASHVDVASLAYLHWRGWEWQACRIVLHALPSCQQCSLEPSWELFERGRSNSNKVRKTLIPESLSYMQTRLHIRPWHIHAMFKTHTRLTSYSPVKLKQKLDFLQGRLQLRSSVLRALIMVMPSLLGASTDALESRMQFWLVQIGLTVSQLRQVVTEKPALMQYSVEDNLRPKLEFFSADLGLDNSMLVRMTLVNPELWGRSLERYLWPMARAFCSSCRDGDDNGMTLTDYGRIVAQVPELLRYSCQTLEHKLQFLRDRLGLTGKQLKSMVQTTPRILLQSIPTSLLPKIDLIESLGANNYTGSREAIRNNPSLLVISKSALKQRLLRSGSLSTPEVSLAEALSKPTTKGLQRKSIWLLSSTSDTREVDVEFSGVAAAASHAETSQSNMYNALRLGRLLNGRQYVYANATKRVSDCDWKKDLDALMRAKVSIDKDFVSLDKYLNQKSEHENESHTIPHLIIYTSGRAFPPEDTVRGRKRSGGLAFQIRNWSAVEWRQTCSKMWQGLRLRLLPDSHTLIVGYPYTRPSRRRCSLYACREALRVATKWLSLITSPNAVISIVSDSNYVLELLHNSSQIMEWGRAETRGDFVFTGPVELHMANPDILYPLARTYYRLVEQDRMLPIKMKSKNVTVHFLPADTSDSARRLQDGAKLAAKLMYDSVR